MNVSHVAPTPVGMQLTATVELVAVEGRSLLSNVECRDEAGIIGSGTHQRAIIDLDNQRLQDKAKP